MPELATTQQTTESAFATDDWQLSAFLASERSRFPGFLWDSILPKQSVVMLAAESFSGKSMFSLGLGLAVARGEPFVGLPTTQAGVLYIALDSALWDYGTQIRKLLGGQDAPPDFHFLSERFRLLDDTWRSRLGDYLRAHSIGLIILDTLRASHDGQENDSGDMQKVLDALREISVEHRTTVLFLHHCPKPAADGQRSDFRGSGVIRDSADVFISMRSQRLGPSAKLLTLAILKGRGVRSTRPPQIRLEWDDEQGTAALDAASEAEVVPVRSLEQAVEDRLAQGPATIMQLVEAVPSDGRKPKTIRNKVDVYLQRMKSGGRVGASREGGRNIWHLPVASGREAA